MKPGDLVQFYLDRVIDCPHFGMILREVSQEESEWGLEVHVDALFEKYGVLRCKCSDLVIVKT